MLWCTQEQTSKEQQKQEAGAHASAYQEHVQQGASPGHNNESALEHMKPQTAGAARTAAYMQQSHNHASAGSSLLCSVIIHLR
jgi:hypothetical protein